MVWAYVFYWICPPKSKIRNVVDDVTKDTPFYSIIASCNCRHCFSTAFCIPPRMGLWISQSILSSAGFVSSSGDHGLTPVAIILYPPANAGQALQGYLCIFTTLRAIIIFHCAAALFDFLLVFYKYSGALRLKTIHYSLLTTHHFLNALCSVLCAHCHPADR
jgi:hypothetical protein